MSSSSYEDSISSDHNGDLVSPLKTRNILETNQATLAKQTTFHLSLQKHYLKKRIQIVRALMRGVRNTAIFGGNIE